MRPQTPPSGTLLNPRDPSASNGSSPNKDLNRQQRLHTEWRNSGGSDAFDNFLAMEEEIDGPQSAPPSPDGSRDKPNDGTPSDVGYTFDELVDRLVSQPVSRQDSKFAAIFLCLYRKFAAPAQLLNALIKRFDRNEKNNSDQLSRIADQLQLLNVMAQWVSEYPGDLAHPHTRKRIVDFVSTLERSHFYMFAAKEVSSYLEIPAEDDDVGWPFSDRDIEELNIPDTPLVSSGWNSPSTFLGGPAPTPQEEEEEEEDPIYNLSAVDLSEGLTDPSMKLSGPPSSSSLVEKPGSIVGQSFTLLSTEAAQKEAHHLELSPMIPISKIVWRQFMDFSDEDVARELTRLDWVMFNSFRPRDLVRHVSISGPDKDKIKSLQNVNRMIKQFNHLAFFVASMILLRDKPKHRARALERFMNIALVSFLFYIDTEINTHWSETAPPEQLQLSWSSNSRNQRDTGPPTLANPRPSPRPGSKGFHEAGYPHGNPEEPLCLSIGMGQLILRTNSFPSIAPSRSRLSRRRKQNLHR